MEVDGTSNARNTVPTVSTSMAQNVRFNAWTLIDGQVDVTKPKVLGGH
jgi:hypothetical protein